MDFGLTFGNYDLPLRNQEAEKIIRAYATKHAKADVGLGLLGFLPVPGAAVASIIGALSLQIPIYKLLVFDLARIYRAEIPDYTANRIVNTEILIGSALNVGADLSADAIVDQFGLDFLAEIAGSLLAELGIGAGISLVPFLGGFVSIGMDVAIAITMTWRVGTMVSIYYQNGGHWVENRKQSHGYAKQFTGGLSITNEGRVKLREVPLKVPDVASHLAAQLSKFAERILRKAPDTSDKELHEMFQEENIPGNVAAKAIEIARKRLR